MPQPLACDRANQWGLYEFIEGHALQSDEITPRHMAQVMEFFQQLNAHKDDAAAGALPIASDACFSIAQHIARVERRMNRLHTLDRSTPASMEAGDLAQSEILPRWRNVCKKILA